MVQDVPLTNTRRIWPYGPNLLARTPVESFGPLARRKIWPVGPKDREHVKSITYKAMARVDAKAKYSHSGDMLSSGL